MGETYTYQPICASLVSFFPVWATWAKVSQAPRSVHAQTSRTEWMDGCFARQKCVAVVCKQPRS